MKRRDFIKRMGIWTAATCGAVGSPLILPTGLFAEDAFTLAIQGQNLIQGKKFDEAAKILEKAVKIDPESDWAWGLLGRAYYGLDKKAESVAAFRSALKLNSGDTYSKMMIDMITQKPIPKIKEAAKPQTPLEKQAMEEEAQYLSKFKADTGLGYKVNRIVIDAGHGGFDPGAVGKNGLKEKDVTLDLALMLQKRLQGKYKTFLTRTGDYYIPLSDRTVIANQYRADLFISLHINANNNRKAKGSETYFCSEKASSKEAQKVAALENSVLKFDEEKKQKPGHIDIEDVLFKFEQKLNWSESGKFAKNFQAKFKQDLPMKSRGVHSANFYVLRRAKMPSILLETGFISNLKTEKMLTQDSFRRKIVDSIVRGLG